MRLHVKLTVNVEAHGLRGAPQLEDPIRRDQVGPRAAAGIDGGARRGSRLQDLLRWRQVGQGVAWIDEAPHSLSNLPHPTLKLALPQKTPTLAAVAAVALAPPRAPPQLRLDSSAPHLGARSQARYAFQHANQPPVGAGSARR